ncbi:hypothetical protein [Pontibacter kalidii]|uniref:hypothetical protein n=1 Tax=Pontibacter kalidii TaxID=2592049 RepID=UPI002254A011|nr:hypothetical protein [Pontibacter kalidii]
MKTLLFPLLLLTSLAAKGQLVAPKDTAKAKQLYIGVTATTMGYNLKYKQEPKGGDIHTYGVLHVGFKLSPRTRVQAGFSYGTAEIDHSYIYVEAEDRLIYYDEVARTRGVAMPITVEYRLFYPFRKLQFYATGMFTPIYSTTRLQKTESRDEVTTITYDENASGFNAYLTAGFGIGYPVTKRLDAYFNYYMISRSINNGLRRKDEYPYPGSLAIGLNYNLNLKREK